MAEPFEPHLLVIFGGTGDLARRKLIPAIYKLLADRGFQDDSWVLGLGNRALTDDQFRSLGAEAVVAAGHEAGGDWCHRRLYYQSMAEGFSDLANRINEIEAAHRLPGNRAFYLALPPDAVPLTVEGLGNAGIHQSKGWTRIVVEKPFGTNLESARGLNQLLHRWFDEEQIYRIDHYLGKESVRNLLVFRLANPLFESSWNRDRVDNVQITVSEDLGVGTRAAYYDRAGALRDIVQNHVTQVVTLVAMEPPVRLGPQDIRDEKVKVLRSILPLGRRQVVRGRYQAGTIDGRAVPAYLEEPGVSPDSTTETFVAIRLGIDNWRWKGVPFYLRTGKRLPRRLTQIAVTFRGPPVSLFDELGASHVSADTLFITLQPEEGFDLIFEVKAPGEETQLRTESLRFRYADAFGPLPDAYETLLADILTGDQTLFVRSDEVEESWRIYQPVLDVGEVHEYPAGSWGPAQAEMLLRRAGDRWSIR